MPQDKQMKKKEPFFGDFPPPKNCTRCDGRGEIKDQYITRFFGSSNWTYKKCPRCKGTGLNKYKCITCNSLMNADSWCANENCKMYNIKVGLVMDTNDN